MQHKSEPTPKGFNYLSDVAPIKFFPFDTTEASLHVYESGTHVPFPIQRLFTIKAHEKCIRGLHAHKECAQLLVCLEGRCVVTVDDGTMRKEFVLDTPNQGLLVPPTIWAEQAYQADSILMVLTNLPYDETDYIRDYEAFKIFRKSL